MTTYRISTQDPYRGTKCEPFVAQVREVYRNADGVDEEGEVESQISLEGLVAALVMAQQVVTGWKEAAKALPYYPTAFANSIEELESTLDELRFL